MKKPRISCIYKITNLVNNKIYIGSTKDFRDRTYHHFSELKCQRHGNIHLQRSYNKHGKHNFKIEIVEECKDSELFSRESYYTKLYKSFERGKGYNICPILIGDKIELSEETRKRMSEAAKEGFRTGKRSAARLKQISSKKTFLYKDNILIKTYDSRRELMKDLDLTINFVTKWVKREKGRVITSNRSKLKGYRITEYLL